MVVLAAAILASAHGGQRQNAKVLLSRQYVQMSRIRIEGLLAAFPKLMPSGKQHTFIETENVRYVYQPFESMTLVLVTNRSSNIVDDLETLRLLGRLLPEIVEPGPDKGQGVQRTDVEVTASTYDIMFAFDECITGGYRNNVAVDYVISCLEMESYEEEVHRMVQQNKVKDAKRVAKEECVRLYLEEHRNRCKRQAVKKRKLRELEQLREEHIEQKLQARLQRQKHEKWQEELRPKRAYGDTLLRLKKGELQQEQDQSEDALKFKHAEKRDGRMELREQQLQEKEKKIDQQLRACQKFRDMDEVDKLRDWKEKEHQRKAHIEDMRLAREEQMEQQREQKSKGALAFAEKFERLEQVRNEKLVHRDESRLARCLEKVQECPQGMAVPMCV